jgi:AcrR family transcriptional regulator
MTAIDNGGAGSETSSSDTGGSGGRRRRNNRRGHGERLREELLDAAGALVAETGDASGLSLRAVAARVGVAATSVYLHFEDLDALKVALAQRCFVEFAEARDAAAGVTDPARSLIVRCQAYARYALTHPGRYRMMFGRDLPLLMSHGPQPSPSLDAFNALIDSIARCQRTGAAPAADPARLATMVWTALHGQAILRIDRPDFPWPPLDDMIAELVSRLVGLSRS